MFADGSAIAMLIQDSRAVEDETPALARPHHGSYNQQSFNVVFRVYVFLKACLQQTAACCIVL